MEKPIQIKRKKFFAIQTKTKNCFENRRMMDMMITFGPRRGILWSSSRDLKLEQIICVAICLLLCVSSSTLSSFAVSPLEIDKPILPTRMISEYNT